MAPSGFMMDARRLTKTALDVHGRLQVRLHQQENDTWMGYIEDPRLNTKDDIGALYYVIAVIFIYGLSIVMMIASHIRKNKQDCQLRAYLKEMALLRKADRREKLMGRISSLAAAAKVRNALKNTNEEPGKTLFRLSSKSSFKLSAKRNSMKESEEAVKQEETGREDGGEADPEAPPSADELRQSLVSKDDALREEMSRQEDGNETADSEFLDLPVDFALDMNRLTPSANVTPLTSASATPSPPPRHCLKSKTKISFEDDAFVL